MAIDNQYIQGMHPDCAMHDCPHKAELVKATDEIARLTKTNTEFNANSQRHENLEKNLLDKVSGVIKELLQGTVSEAEAEKIVAKVTDGFDVAKTSDIAQDNVNLRQESLTIRRELRARESEIRVLKEEKQALESERRFEEERNLRVIDEMRNMGKKNEDQLAKIRDNDAAIKRQDLLSKDLERFLEKARLEVSELQTRHKMLADQNTLYERNIRNGKKALSRKAKAVLKLSTEVMRLKPMGSGFMGARQRRLERSYFRLKQTYPGLSEPERDICVIQYHAALRTMGDAP